jgi:hypothetical protein
MDNLRQQLERNEKVVIEWYSAFMNIMSKYPDEENLVDIYKQQYLKAKAVSNMILENIQRQEQYSIPPKKRKISVVCQLETVPVAPKNKRKLTPPQRITSKDNKVKSSKPRNTFNGLNYQTFRATHLRLIQAKYPGIRLPDIMKKVGKRWARYKELHHNAKTN